MNVQRNPACFSEYCDADEALPDLSRRKTGSMSILSTDACGSGGEQHPQDTSSDSGDDAGDMVSGETGNLFDSTLLVHEYDDCGGLEVSKIYGPGEWREEGAADLRVHTYSQSGRLEQLEFVRAGDTEPSAVRTYEYDGAGRLSVYDAQTFGTGRHYREEYDYSEGRLNTDVERIGDPLEVVASGAYEYDTSGRWKEYATLSPEGEVRFKRIAYYSCGE